MMVVWVLKMIESCYSIGSAYVTLKEILAYWKPLSEKSFLVKTKMSPNWEGCEMGVRWVR